MKMVNLRCFVLRLPDLEIQDTLKKSHGPFIISGHAAKQTAHHGSAGLERLVRPREEAAAVKAAV
jgi:hypothetical protein